MGGYDHTRRVMTVYCDQPSHTREPVGPFVRSPQSDADAQIQLDSIDGLFVVAMFWNYAWTSYDDGQRYTSPVWLPQVRLLTAAQDIWDGQFHGLAKDRGGKQADDRHRLRCGRCDLTYTATNFSDTLHALYDNDIRAVSLRALIDHR